MAIIARPMADAGSKKPLTPVTVLFADITGSTLLYAQRGDATAFALASACLDLVEQHVSAEGGRVVKRLGDGVLAVFGEPAAALQAAVRTRRSLADPENMLNREGVQVHAGISAGPAVLAADDVYGDVVNVAARLVGLAKGDEILLSGAVYEALPPDVREQVRLIDQLLLRNRPVSVLVYEYVGEESDATVSSPVRMRASTATLEVAHGDRLFVVGPERPKVTIGRDAASDICIKGDLVSRTHAEVALRGDKFVLADRSTNGTYVHVDRGPVLRIVREEIALSGSGRIVPGVETDPPITYRVMTA